MTRVRQLVIGLASGSALYSGFVSALGLGEITLHSALNQPLNAEIELLAVGDASAADVKISLASADAFERAGVERIYFLNDLRFSPLLRGNNSVIRVVSSQPVREPYLNFIVELKRPGGQQQREYTVLLDPPGSSSYSPQAAASGSESFTSYAPPRRTPIASRGERYQVSSGESLWTIASKLRVEGNQGSLQDLMLDIHALNPDAFSNGDIHRLRAGVSLLLPDHARLAEAAPAQPTDSASAPAGTAPAQIIPDTAPERPAEPQVELAAQIRRVEEEVANRTAENLQLQQDLLTVQNQLQDLMQRMEERDQQIAQLMEVIAQRSAVSEAAPAAQPTAPTQAAEAPAAPVQAPATSVQTDQPPQAEGFWSLWNMLLAGLLALLALLLLFKRKRKPAVIAEPVVVVPPVTEPQEPTEPAPAARSVVADVPLPVRPQVVTPPPAPQPPLDPLEGASIYLAYGRLGEAAAALRQASQAQPLRLDIRYRLLEVLAQQGNLAAFADEEDKLRAAGFDGLRIDELKGRYPALFEQATEDPHAEFLQPLEELNLELDETPEPAAEQAEDSQLNLDDLSLDADWDLISPFAPETRKKRDEPEAPADEPVVDIPGHDARSPYAGAMLVEEEFAEEWLAELDDVAEPEFEQLPDEHGHMNKLNLALAYIEEHDLEAACDILNEVINEGDEDEKQEARELLSRIA